VVAVSAAMMLVLAAACGETKTIEVPGETVVVTKEVIKTIEVPGQTITKEVIKEVAVPGETIVVEKEVVKTIEVPGQTILVEKEVVKTVEVIKTVAGPERVVVRDVLAPAGKIFNVWGELADKPQYGGTLSLAIPMDITDFDPYYGGYPWARDGYSIERLGEYDWTLPHDEMDWTAGYRDRSNTTGGIAESWEVDSDTATTIFHIRKGVQWHDKPPVNGRELTAYDVESSFHRMLGLGEFAEVGPSPHAPDFNSIQGSTVVATDRYTLEVISPAFDMGTIDTLTWYNWAAGYVVPPEPYAEYGDMRDWRNVVGTGPYMITNVVPGSKVTYTKHPNYWMKDPIYPDENLQLPYIDQVNHFIIPDLAARVAALRTGKVEYLAGPGLLNLDQVDAIERTNPELIKIPVAGASITSPGFNSYDPPFNNLRVRQAMQKALNLEEINDGYYQGQGDATPWGLFAGAARGLYVPYDEWSEEVKWAYEYDPAAAEKLLDEAGYPRDGDGIRFKTNWDITPSIGHDVDLAQIAKMYWDQIGVDVNLTVIGDNALAVARKDSLEYGGMADCGCRFKPAGWSSLKGRFYSGGAMSGGFGVADPVFDAMADKVDASSDFVEWISLIQVANQQFAEQMYALYFPVAPQFGFYQPYLRGYFGQNYNADEAWSNPVAYLWLDDSRR
jgi:peptide/nickel transport system substrate-binding protein